MARSYLKLNIRRPLKDGSYPVQIAVGYGRDLYIGTGISCGIADWDEKTSRCTGPNSRVNNLVLESMLENVNNAIMRLREECRFGKLTNKELRAVLTEKAHQTVPSKPTLGAMFRTVIESKAKASSTLSLYESTLQKLEEYCDPYTTSFEDVNRLWLEGFVASMDNLAVNTRSIHLRNLRAVMNYAIDCGVTANYPFRRFSIPTESTKKRNLSAAVLRNLATAELSPTLSKWRDLFMLSFYLIGINVVDLCGLRTIEDGRIDYVRAKTGKRYSIKVWPEAKAIIEKYSGKDHLLYMLDEYSDYRKFYQCYESGLRNIAKALGIPALTSYYSRHSWATLASKLDIPKETIAAALGHELGNATTSIYIDYDITKVDAANRRIIDYVLYNKK